MAARSTATLESTESVELDGLDEFVANDDATETVENAETPAPEAEVEVVLSEDLVSAANAAVDNADPTTGTPALQFIEAVTKAYHAIAGIKGKNLAKKFVDAGMVSALSEVPPNAPKAVTFSKLREAINESAAPKAPSAPRAPADPKVAYIQQAAALAIAGALLPRPDGVDDEQVQEAVTEAWDAAVALFTFNTAEQPEGVEAPEVSKTASTAVRYAMGKGVGTGSGRTAGSISHDVQVHIDEAFASLESGAFLSVADLVKFDSAEYAGGRPATSAVTGRLFPKSGDTTLTGVVPVEKTETTPRGAAKV